MEANRRGFLKALGFGAAAATPVAAAAAVPAPLQAEGDRNPFEIPLDIVPKGMRYEWKRVFIDQQQHDAVHLAELLQHGWQPVPAARHREVFGKDFHNWVEVGGLVLMEKSLAAIECDRPKTHDPMAGLR